MNRHVNAIAGRLSLRPPQRRSLEILDRITEIVPPRRGADLQAALATIKSEFPTVTDFGAGDLYVGQVKAALAGPGGRSGQLAHM